MAEQALPHAVAIAQRFQAELILLRVLVPLQRSPTAIPAALQDADQALTRYAREYLEHVAADVQERDIRLQIATIEGRPHLQIIQYAETNQVHLIVMCTRGQ